MQSPNSESTGAAMSDTIKLRLVQRSFVGLIALSFGSALIHLLSNDYELTAVPIVVTLMCGLLMSVLIRWFSGPLMSLRQLRLVAILFMLFSMGLCLTGGFISGASTIWMLQLVSPTFGVCCYLFNSDVEPLASKKRVLVTIGLLFVYLFYLGSIAYLYINHTSMDPSDLSVVSRHIFISMITGLYIAHWTIRVYGNGSDAEQRERSAHTALITFLIANAGVATISAITSGAPDQTLLPHVGALISAFVLLIGKFSAVTRYVSLANFAYVSLLGFFITNFFMKPVPDYAPIAIVGFFSGIILPRRQLFLPYVLYGVFAAIITQAMTVDLAEVTAHLMVGSVLLWLAVFWRGYDAGAESGNSGILESSNASLNSRPAIIAALICTVILTVSLAVHQYISIKGESTLSDIRQLVITLEDWIQTVPSSDLDDPKTLSSQLDQMSVLMTAEYPVHVQQVNEDGDERVLWSNLQSWSRSIQDDKFITFDISTPQAQPTSRTLSIVASAEVVNADLVSRVGVLSAILVGWLAYGLLASNQRQFELRRARRESAFISSIIEELRRGLFLVSNTGEVLFSNSMLVEVCGLPARESVDVLLSASDNSDRLVDEVCRGKRYQRRFDDTSTSGFANPIAFSLVPFQTSNQQLALGIVINMRDELERVDAIERLRLLEIEQRVAYESDMAKSSFIANLSHEMRTPLNAILGYTYLLDTSETDDQQKSLLTKLHDTTQTLVNLVNDVLDISSIESGEFELINEPFELDQLLRNLRGICEPLAKERGLELAIETVSTTEKQTLLGDALRIQQILVNLISNSIKFSSTGSIRLKTERVQESADRERIRFDVIDTGIGIAEEAQAHLFDRFSQVHDVSMIGQVGTGLGLAIVRELAERMDGAVSVSSAPGKGSTFTVSISLPISTEELSSSTNQLNDLKPHGNRLQGKTVMIVDDNELNADVAHRILTMEGATVHVCHDGEAALAFLSSLTEAEMPDIILMDLYMPRVDGFTAAEIMRRDSRLRYVPIIGVTAGAIASERDRAHAVGMNDYLTKPYSPPALVQLLLTQLAARTVQGS